MRGGGGGWEGGREGGRKEGSEGGKEGGGVREGGRIVMFSVYDSGSHTCMYETQEVTVNQMQLMM